MINRQAPLNAQLKSGKLEVEGEVEVEGEGKLNQGTLCVDWHKQSSQEHSPSSLNFAIRCRLEEVEEGETYKLVGCEEDLDATRCRM